MQTSAIFADSVRIRGAVNAHMTDQGLRATATSGASILFNLEPGHWYSYALSIVVESRSEGGIAIADMSLSLLGPRGGAVESLHAQCGPGRTRLTNHAGFDHRGILEAGDYDFEFLANADAAGSDPGGWDAGSSFDIGLKLWVIPTAVDETTWARMKSLYGN